MESHALLKVADGVLDLSAATIVGLNIRGFAFPVSNAGVVTVVDEPRRLGAGHGLDPADDDPHGRGVGLTVERKHRRKSTR